MARALTLALLAQILTTSYAARVMTDVTESEGTGFSPLCDNDIVEETCEMLDEDGDGLVDARKIRDSLSSTLVSAGDLWRTLKMKDDAVSCASFCDRLVAYLKGHQWILPETSDVGCYEDDGGDTKCDLDLSPDTLGGPEFHPDGDMPDFHAREPENAGSGELDEVEEEEELHYSVDELAMRLANLFRIYPELHVGFDDAAQDVDMEERGSPSLLQGNSSAGRRSWRSQVQRVNQQAEAYVSTALRNFLRKSTGSQVNTWFGYGAVSGYSQRNRIKKVLNSIDYMVSKVDYVYPGPKCSPNTYAYVYPKAYTCRSWELNSKPCTKNDRGQYVFYMCDFTMRAPIGEQIETITHEGSHHATAYTDDVDFNGRTAYGRSTCRQLAQQNPRLSLDNADNYCYYIQDITDRRR